MGIREDMMTKKYTKEDQRVGALIMSIAAVFAFLFPLIGRWILMAFALILIYSAFIEED